MTKFYVGQRIRYSGVFTVAGVPTDPTEVTVQVMGPNDVTISTYTWVAGAQVVKDSVGNFHYDVTLTKEGDWWFKMYGTGAIVAAQVDMLSTERTPFDS